MKEIGTKIFQECKTYIPASIEVFRIYPEGMFCQSSYQAADTVFGDTGSAGAEIPEINYGGSF